MTVPAEAGTARLRARDFEVVGSLRHPVVVALGGISASSHVLAHAGDPTPG